MAVDSNSIRAMIVFSSLEFPNPQLFFHDHDSLNRPTDLTTALTP